MIDEIALLIEDPTTWDSEELAQHIRELDRLAIELKLLVISAQRRKRELRLEVYRRRHV